MKACFNRYTHAGPISTHKTTLCSNHGLSHILKRNNILDLKHAGMNLQVYLQVVYNQDIFNPCMGRHVKTTRLCKKCQQILPLHQFNGTSRYCHDHPDARRKYPDIAKTKRAVSAIRYRVWDDKKIFQQPEHNISFQDIRDLLTPTQLDTFTEWALVPDDPTLPVCKSNAVVVGNKHHMFLLNIWQHSKDLKKYRHFLHEHTFVDYADKQYKK